MTVFFFIGPNSISVLEVDAEIFDGLCCEFLAKFRFDTYGKRRRILMCIERFERDFTRALRNSGAK